MDEPKSFWQRLKENIQNVILQLAGSRKFWLALFGLVQTIVFALNPNFPPQIWQAIDAFVLVLIATIFGQNVAGILKNGE